MGKGFYGRKSPSGLIPPSVVCPTPANQNSPSTLEGTQQPQCCLITDTRWRRFETSADIPTFPPHLFTYMAGRLRQFPCTNDGCLSQSNPLGETTKGLILCDITRPWRDAFFCAKHGARGYNQVSNTLLYVSVYVKGRGTNQSSPSTGQTNQDTQA